MQATIVVGPVIGFVSETTARVLAEVDIDAEVTCTLVNIDKDTKHTAKLALRSKRPGVFKFSDLTPGCVHLVEFPDTTNVDSRKGRLRTQKIDAPTYNVVSLSCNSLGEEEEPVVWDSLIEKYLEPGYVDLILHVGDQVYADAAFINGLAMVKEAQKAKKFDDEGVRRQLQEEIRELYRDFYRRTWNYPPTRKALSMVSNVSIWDDHDIRDDWGSHSKDRDPESDEYFVGLQARQTFWEYQRQLWDDVFDAQGKVAKNVQTESHFHKLGSLGIIVMDSRGSRTFYYDSDRPFVSTYQWNLIQEALLPGGIFGGGDTKNLIVAISVALCCAGTKTSKLAGEIMKDKMGFGLHPQEQIDLIQLLHNWKKSQANRSLLVIGGDLHVGIKSEIFRGEEVVCEQLITSPIRQHPPPGVAKNILQSLMNIPEKLTDGYGFKHVEFKPRRNFGIITVESHLNLPCGIYTHLFTQARDKKKKKMKHVLPFKKMISKKSKAKSHLQSDSASSLQSLGEGILTLSNIMGHGLAAKDSGGTSDPYMAIHLLGMRVRSRTIMKTLNPCWVEEYSFPLHKLSYQHHSSPCLRINVWDADVGNLDDRMGLYEIDLTEFLRARDEDEEDDKRTLVIENAVLEPKNKEKVSGHLSFTLSFSHFPY
eukprot:TRINITY_DN2334_c0_g1_i2.p1 TRINITY_DN2334_c0_g1~~TRINITY_DN2334_c0_g1_i2.p1  ORF type:complete len:689 (-),score=149.41 TRINITY_DN2334_c0_g1_i2:203-2149(-)